MTISFADKIQQILQHQHDVSRNRLKAFDAKFPHFVAFEWFNYSRKRLDPDGNITPFDIEAQQWLGDNIGEGDLDWCARVDDGQGIGFVDEEDALAFTMKFT